MHTSSTLQQNRPDRGAAMPPLRGRPAGSPFRVGMVAGNMASQRLLFEAGLRRSAVSGALSPDEDEAERHADDMAAMMTGHTAHTKCAACAAGAAPCPKCGVQRKAIGPAPAYPNVSQFTGDAFRSGGEPLRASHRDLFEQRTGTDLSGVRIHTDGHASAAANAVNAPAEWPATATRARSAPGSAVSWSRTKPTSRTRFTQFSFSFTAR